MAESASVEQGAAWVETTPGYWRLVRDGQDVARVYGALGGTWGWQAYASGTWHWNCLQGGTEPTREDAMAAAALAVRL